MEEAVEVNIQEIVCGPSRRRISGVEMLRQPCGYLALSSRRRALSIGMMSGSWLKS